MIIPGQLSQAKWFDYTSIISLLLPIVTFQKNYFCINIFCTIHFFLSIGLLETRPFKIHR